MSKKTPAQIREEQEAQQRALDERNKAFAHTVEQHRIKEMSAAAEAIKASWYPATESASKRSPNYRFVIVAEVLGQPAALPEVLEAIRADGFTCDTITWFDAREGMVVDNSKGLGVQGWRPNSLPRLGNEGGVKYLVVRW